MAFEHRLINGGEQWLPFARSRIKTLRATGQLYASQKFDIDGCTIKVRIEPGQEYIEISGGKCSIKMDSGVIEVRTVNPESELAYEPGTYYDTTRTTTYNAAFTQLSSDGKWFTHPIDAADRGYTGQLSGDVTYSRGFRGAIPADRVPPKSFAPKKLQEKNEDGSEKYDAHDDTLVSKKATVDKFPASCWTGRMRLYVQAMYGQELYSYDGEGEGKLNIGCSAWGYELPGLLIPGYAPDSGSVAVNVSAGVILTDDGNHWLVSIGTGMLAIFPLRGSKCAEAARKLLTVGSPLATSEKEHLEAYVLSSSRPVVAEMQTVYLAAEYPQVAMGYGFHWNWSGTAADIVGTIEESQPGSTLGIGHVELSSTHWRIAPTSSKTDDGRKWSATAFVVEGPVVWTVSYSVWSVFYPVWGLFKASARLFPRYSTWADTANAPFYVFYRKDELNVCRYTRERRPAGPILRSSDPPGIGPGAFYCEGNRAATFKHTDAGNAYNDIAFSIGSTTHNTLAFGLTTSGQRGIWSGGSKPSPTDEATVWATGTIVSYPEGQSSALSIGYPSSYDTAFITGPCQFATGYVSLATSYINMTSTTDSITEGMGGYAVVIIPFHDAEAVFYHNHEIQNLDSTGKTVTNINSASNHTYAYVFRGSPAVLSETLLTYAYGPSGLNNTVNSTTYVPDSSEVVLDTTKQVLHCGAGEITTANMYGTLTDFFSTADEVVLTYLTAKTSAIGGADATVFASYVTPPRNTTLTNPVLPAIVGWA